MIRADNGWLYKRAACTEGTTYRPRAGWSVSGPGFVGVVRLLWRCRVGAVLRSDRCSVSLGGVYGGGGEAPPAWGECLC